MSNSNTPLELKNILCKYGCGTRIRFNPNLLSEISQKLIPLNMDNSPHNCPNRPYKKDSKRICRYCNQTIIFHDDVTAPSGKKIPLNLDSTVHDCESNPFNRSRKERS